MGASRLTTSAWPRLTGTASVRAGYLALAARRVRVSTMERDLTWFRRDRGEEGRTDEHDHSQRADLDAQGTAGRVHCQRRESLWRGRDGGPRPRRDLGRFPRGPVHRDHGTVRLGQVDPAALPGRPGPADLRAGAARRRRPRLARRQDHDPAAPRAHRFRVPGFQPHSDPDRAGEHRPAADPGRQEARPGLGQGTGTHAGDRRPPRAPSGRTLRRPAAAGRDGTGADHPARPALRRRADRQPRLQVGDRAAHPDPPGRRPVPADRGHGHA
jgi:hypothetical protein